ncbi:unnamed protein product [Closterium sp. NIES-54]
MGVGRPGAAEEVQRRGGARITDWRTDGRAPLPFTLLQRLQRPTLTRTQRKRMQGEGKRMGSQACGCLLPALLITHSEARRGGAGKEAALRRGIFLLRVLASPPASMGMAGSVETTRRAARTEVRCCSIAAAG